MNTCMYQKEINSMTLKHILYDACALYYINIVFKKKSIFELKFFYIENVYHMFYIMNLELK